MADEVVLAQKYAIVFSHTAATGGYAGVRFRMGFRDKDDFDAWYTPEVRMSYEVVAEGVSDTEAVHLCKQTPVSSYVRAAMQEACRAREGNLEAAFLRRLTSTYYGLLCARAQEHTRV